jgi:hypothetical protein
VGCRASGQICAAISVVAGRHLRQRNSLRVPGKRRRMPGDDTFAPENLPTVLEAANAIPAGAGDGFEHRQHGYDYRKPAKYSYRVDLRNQLSALPLSASARRRNWPVHRLAGAALAVSES